jgi:hypothetical protein
MELLEGRLSPITGEIGFIEAAAKDVADAFVAWQAPIQKRRGVDLVVRQVRGSLDEVLRMLLPLTSVERRRYLFVPTNSAWTAYLDNGSEGTDAFSAMSFLARQMGCRGLRVVHIEDTIQGRDRDARGRYGATILEIYGPVDTDFLNYVRSVAVANDGGRWVFTEAGERQPFEEIDRYAARRVRDRFTPDMLHRYLRALGLRAFDEDFYLPDGAPAALIEKHGPVAPGVREFTIEDLQASY